MISPEFIVVENFIISWHKHPCIFILEGIVFRMAKRACLDQIVYNIVSYDTKYLLPWKVKLKNKILAR